MDGRTLRVVVAGGGRVGSRAGKLLDGRGHDVVVVERDPERCERLSDDYFATVIEGDATDPDVLRQAPLDRADAVLSLLPEERENLAVCLIAERLADDLRTVLRATDEAVETYEPLVDEVVYPERAGARTAANAVESGIRALEGVSGDVEILEIAVREGAPAAGRTLAEVALPEGSLVVTDAGGGALALPETTLDPGKRYVVAVDPRVEDEVVDLFRG